MSQFTMVLSYIIGDVGHISLDSLGPYIVYTLDPIRCLDSRQEALNILARSEVGHIPLDSFTSTIL
jgi:hypothetical protein